MAASLTVMRFSVMKSWRLVHESGRPICHQSLACLNASSCANDAASAPKFDANCSAMMPICRPGSLPFPPPCKATHTQPINWGPRRREPSPPTPLNGADSSISACLPSPARSCPPLPHRPCRQRRRSASRLASWPGLLALAFLTNACAPPHPSGTLIVASKDRIDSLDALRSSPAMGLHQSDYIQLPPAAIGDLEPLDPAGADAQLFQMGSTSTATAAGCAAAPWFTMAHRCLNCPWARCRRRCRIGRCRWEGTRASERELGPAGAVKRSTTDPVGAIGSFKVILFGSKNFVT
jgi:hypothetical protein